MMSFVGLVYTHSLIPSHFEQNHKFCFENACSALATPLCVLNYYNRFCTSVQSVDVCLRSGGTPMQLLGIISPCLLLFSFCPEQYCCQPNYEVLRGAVGQVGATKVTTIMIV